MSYRHASLVAILAIVVVLLVTIAEFVQSALAFGPVS